MRITASFFRPPEPNPREGRRQKSLAAGDADHTAKGSAERTSRRSGDFKPDEQHLNLKENTFPPSVQVRPPQGAHPGGTWMRTAAAAEQGQRGGPLLWKGRHPFSRDPPRPGARCSAALDGRTAVTW